MSARPPAIALHGITKTYRRLAAVKDLSLEVHAGEVLGFLGLNGAGKTTTIRILLDLIRPTAGRAEVFGLDCQARGLEARAHVGYLPGELGLHQDLTGRAALDLLARLGGRPVDARRRGALLERLALPAADLDRPLREYSSGMVRKLGLVQAFQADPPLLVLDEPTEGLDPLMQEAFYGLVAEVRAAGRTVFMSSHVLTEVERVCDRIALLRAGELALLAGVEEVRRRAARRVRVSFSGEVARVPHLPPGHRLLEAGPRRWSLRVEGPLGPLLRLLAELPAADLEVEEPRLEEVVLGYFREGSA